jgi:hypothetical protein
MTQNEAILAILAEAGIEADQTVGESTAFDVLERNIEGALEEIDNGVSWSTILDNLDKKDDDDDDD